MRRNLRITRRIVSVLRYSAFTIYFSYQEQKNGSKRKIGLLLTLKKNQFTLRCYICCTCFW